MNAPETPDGSTVLQAEPDRDARSLVHAFCARVAYWAPVLAVVVLFAQISFQGLRPALSESKRLAAAEVVLGARHERATQMNRDIQAQLAARQDPLFLERQRRSRTIPPRATER